MSLLGIEYIVDCAVGKIYVFTIIRLGDTIAK